MAQEKPNRFVEWYLLLLRNMPVLRRHVADWAEAVREEPVLIWQTPAIRYSVYFLCGLILVSTVGWVAGALTPPPPAGAQAEATEADFHVICSERFCATHFAVRRPFGFSKFPVRCPKCDRITGYAARKCGSEACNGQWVVPTRVEGVARCPVCDAPFP